MFTVKLFVRGNPARFPVHDEWIRRRSGKSPWKTRDFVLWYSPRGNMKFSRLSALSVAIGAGAAFACGGGDTSTPNSQGGTDSSESASTSSADLSTAVSAGQAGAAKSDAGTSTPGPDTKTFGSSVDASAATGSAAASTSS